MKLVVMILVALFVVACGRGEAPPPKAEKEPVFTAMPAVSQAEQELRRQEEVKAREAEVRKAEVADLKANLAILKGEKLPVRYGDDAPAWKVTLRQGTPADVSTACELLKRYDAGQYVWNTLEGHYDQRTKPPLTYEDFGITPNQLRELKRTAGLAAAKVLHTAFQKPQKGTCGRGEGSFDLDNALEVVERLIIVLDDLEAEPSTIGTTPAAMRASVLKYLRAEVATIRQAFKEGKGSISDFYAPNISELAQTAQRWNFTPKDLGLNAEELAFLK